MSARTRKAFRSCYLPHQHVNGCDRPPPGMLRRMGIFSGNILNGSSSLLRDGAPSEIFTNLLKTNFLDKSHRLDSKTLAENTDKQNFLMSDPSSRVVPPSRGVDCTPAGLTAAALNINFSSLGRLYVSAGAVKDPNSSNRVSRAASPALGNSAENNRLTNWTKKKHTKSCFFVFFIFPYISSSV